MATLTATKHSKYLEEKRDETVSTVEFGQEEERENETLDNDHTNGCLRFVPGAHKQEQQEQGKGKGKGKGKQKPIDVKKIRKLKQFKKLSKKEKDELLPRGELSKEQFQRLREKFGSLDIYQNPPTHELQSVPVTPSGEVIATVEQMKSNPPVKAVPSKGQFTMDVTGEFVKGASVVVTANGAASQLNVGTLEVPPSGSLDKSYGKIVRINMFRRKAGFTVVDAVRQPEYIISVETGGKQYR